MPEPIISLESPRYSPEPIISLDSPVYSPEDPPDDPPRDPSDDPPRDPRPQPLETCPASFPGTTLTCFAYVNDAHTVLMRNLQRLVSNPDDPPGFEMKYPGPQPLSIDSSHFDTIRAGDYVVSPKTDGVRCCMMLCDALDGVHTVSIYDRKLQQCLGVFIQHVPRAMYQGGGTLLDGELVVDRLTNKWTFLIFDCVYLCSIPQFQKPYTERMRVISRCLCMSYQESPDDTLKLDVKAYVPLHEAPMTPEALRDDRYLADGFVYMPVDQPIIFGHHHTFFKLKTEHSVDFLFQKGFLMIFNASTKRHVRAGVPESGTPGGYADGSILECVLVKYDTHPGKRVWRVLGQRHDKNKCNTLFVMEKTLLNMQENLSYAAIRGLKSRTV